MPGRIVPYMLRRTSDEWRRRRDAWLAKWWRMALTPARVFGALWR